MTQPGRVNDLAVVGDFLDRAGLNEEKNKDTKDAWLRIRGDVRRVSRISSTQLQIAQNAVRARDAAQEVIDAIASPGDPEPDKG